MNKRTITLTLTKQEIEWLAIALDKAGLAMEGGGEREPVKGLSQWCFKFSSTLERKLTALSK
jgi:hypothetical protein